MIHSTVSPAEAEATQRQVDRLFEMLQQLVHDTCRWLATRHQQQQEQKEALRIWMVGKDGLILRQVYGPMVNGQHRNDLTPERLRQLLDALQQPAIQAENLTHYVKQKPGLEIKMGSLVLFRQERDGVVTINQIHLQRQAQQQEQSSPATTSKPLPANSPGKNLLKIAKRQQRKGIELD